MHVRPPGWSRPRFARDRASRPVGGRDLPDLPTAPLVFISEREKTPPRSGWGISSRRATHPRSDIQSRIAPGGDGSPPRPPSHAVRVGEGAESPNQRRPTTAALSPRRLPTTARHPHSALDRGTEREKERVAGPLHTQHARKTHRVGTHGGKGRTGSTRERKAKQQSGEKRVNLSVLRRIHTHLRASSPPPATQPNKQPGLCADAHRPPPSHTMQDTHTHTRTHTP